MGLQQVKKQPLPFSLYHSGKSLSPPLPTQTWNPGSLAGAEETNLSSCNVKSNR